MKKGQVLTGVAERIDFPNRGIVRVDAEGEDAGTAQYCVVKNALPGQRVAFCVSKAKKGKAEGRLLAVEERGSAEIESPCPHFGSCGGCIYMSLPYGEQLRIKEAQVKKLLDPLLCARQDMPYAWEGIKASPAEYEYRNKMEFSFGDEAKDGPLALGMHKRGSFYDIVTVSECRIVDGDYRKIAEATLQYFTETGASFFHRLTHAGYLRHLLVRKASKTGEILIALVTTTQESHDLKPYQERLLGLSLCGKIVGILHTHNDATADVVKSDKTAVLYGRDYFYETLLGLQFKISQFSFFQTNSFCAEVLYQTVREYLGEAGRGKIVYDLYSGTGTIAQMLAPAAKWVAGVEIVAEAAEAARENAALNGLGNCEFIAGDVLQVLDGIAQKPDIIVLDPPRDGVHPKALQKIIAYGVEKIVYISCKPTSLVRDLEAFLEKGYVVERAVAVDQFPWTGNVEVVVGLQRQDT